LFPLAARANDNDSGLRRAYLIAVAGVGLLSFPTFGFVALMSNEIVALLLGTKWTIAAEVLMPLSLAMIGHAIEALCGPILGGRGEPRVELHVKLITLAVMLPLLAFAASTSLAAVGWSVVLVYLFRWICMNAAIMKRLDVSLKDIGQALLGPLSLVGICWLAAMSVGALFGEHTGRISPLWLLLITATCCIVGCTSALLLLPQLMFGPLLLALLDRLIKQNPMLMQLPGVHRLLRHCSL
jgi:O-antigen/teichoic acid export membrane protein